MENKITFKKLVELVLEEAKQPLTPLEIWGKAQEMHLTEKLGTVGKTPHLTISAQLYVDIRDNPKSPFYQFSSRPGRFFLKKYKSGFKPEEIPLEEETEETKTKYHERDLHPLLVKFVNSAPNFKAHVKTIYHEIAMRNKKGLNKWLYPDLVGVHLPFLDFDVHTLQVQKELYWTAVRFFSFEMKKELNIGNLRECYFQAVSNSNWANEGYLVVLNIIDQDGELMSELRRLNNAFGIGVIQLNSIEINESEIILPAKIKQELDWDTIDLLLKKNGNFKEFMEIVKGDITLGKISNKDNYDSIIPDEAFQEYIEEKGIV
ncbi:MAG: HTH domain-containing protein [Candidatus Pacearchaeota archaeon]